MSSPKEFEIVTIYLEENILNECQQKSGELEILLEKLIQIANVKYVSRNSEEVLSQRENHHVGEGGDQETENTKLVGGRAAFSVDCQ